MPEMPEVEVMTRRLQRWVGYSIHGSSSEHDRYLSGSEKTDIHAQTIHGVYRRGKFIIFSLDEGAILCHNAMSGFWDSDDDRWTFDYVEGSRSSGDNDIRASIIVALPEEPLRTARKLLFHDSRKFGYLKYVTPEELSVKISGVGPEMLLTRNSYEPNSQMKQDEFIDLCRSVKHPIKQLLMDQTRIAGVGNIYAAEGCWAASVNPIRPANSLTEEQAFRVYHGTKAALQSALDRNLDYSQLSVYRRSTCPQCTTKIVGVELKGRKTWYCPECQK